MRLQTLNFGSLHGMRVRPDGEICDRGRDIEFLKENIDI